MGNLKPNIPMPNPRTGPIWKRLTIYLAVISTLAATPVIVIVDERSAASDLDETMIATLCIGAKRDNYVEPDADYSCSDLL